MAYELRPWDREWFKRCRRAWDLGSRTRRNLEPLAASWPFRLDLDRALRDALAVYYFPGMWEWDRTVVLPLAFQAFTKAVTQQRERHEATTPLTAEEREDWERQLAHGKELLEQYIPWARTVDRFWPVRVETDFDAQVPDFRNPGTDLVSPGGQPIHYQGRVDMLVVDEHDAYWIVRHRLVSGGFPDIDLLFLDDEQVAACWAWELFYLGMRISGTIHNEFRLGAAPPDPADPVRRPRPSHAWARARANNRAVAQSEGYAPEPATTPAPRHRRMYAKAEREPDEVVVEEGGGMFRRTRIPRSRAELDALAERLAREALDMTDPGLVVYPAPSVAHCSVCRYRAPCLAMNEAGDVEAVLSGGYRIRPPEVPEEGRLGAVTWSMNRGAAPPRPWVRKERH
jgi:hypothetical protein